MDLPRHHTIREGDARIVNAFTPEKLALLAQAIRLRPGDTLLDLASGRGEMLCTWARDHQISGTGVDISTVSVGMARRRADELGVADRVGFVHDTATGYVADQPVDVACCIGATWIGGGVAGTVELLERSLRPGGMLLIGEPYWQLDPPDQATVEACSGEVKESYADLPGLIELFQGLGWDLVEWVLADPDSWDQHSAAQWLTVRRWLDENPDDELAGEFRVWLTEAPRRLVLRRKYLGWGVFALLKR